jgi:hypothetical protein
MISTSRALTAIENIYPIPISFSRLCQSSLQLNHRKAMSFVIAMAILIPVVFNTPLFSDLAAQSDEESNISLRRPTTTMVVPTNYTADTNSNNLQFYDVQPTTTNASSFDRSIESPMVASPSYTITNTTLTFGTDVLTSDEVPTGFDVYVANRSLGMINGTQYR